MQCLKCGREIPAEQVFCQECLADMGKYPVKPGTPIRIPKRQETAQVKKPQHRRPAAAPEVQIKRLKQRLWITRALLVAVLILAGAAAWLGLNYIWEKEGMPLPGQNYSSVTDTATGEADGT